MSGETEEMTADDKSVESALIWTDNPELEYFRSIITNRTDDDKLASCDSLIGDSTVREMLEIGGGSPLRRVGLRDTSGLSDAESNTVDKIYIEDGSLLAKNISNRVFDDGTIESPEDGDLVPPIMRTHVEQNANHNQRPNIRYETHENHPPNRQPQCVFSPAQMNVPHGVHRGDTNVNVESKESASIPGYIFVTEGHPSIVHTKSADLQSDQPKKYKKKGKAICLPRNLIVCLTLVVLVACTVVAVLLHRIKMESSDLMSSSSQNQKDGSFLSPNSQPTSEPSSLRANNRPQIGTPTSYPNADELDVYDNPSGAPSTSPSISIQKNAQASTPTSTPTDTPKVPQKSLTAEPTSLPPTGQPTSLPTPSVSATFTVAETSSSCLSTIATDETCYQTGDNIQISFTNCKPKPTDWIGIYPARQGVSNLNQPLAWLWTCGDQFCNDSVISGVATIYRVSRLGWYRAYLFRDDENSAAGSYTAYAIGNSFSISSRCN